MSKDKNEKEKDKKDISITEIIQEVLTGNIKEDEIEPLVLSETPVKVFNGKEKVDLTVLEIDAGSMLKISGRIKDMYDFVRYFLQYRIKEIEDSKEFMKNNDLNYIMNVMEAIDDVDKKKTKENQQAGENKSGGKVLMYDMFKNNLNK